MAIVGPNDPNMSLPAAQAATDNPHLTLEIVRTVLQTISSLAIAGGFLFGAIQFKNVRRAQVVANFTKLVELQMQLRRMRVDDPTLALVYRHDASGMASHDEVRKHFFNLMQLSLFEIAWYSNKHGMLTDDYFQTWEDRMKVIQGEESFRRMWTQFTVKIIHNEFEAYMTNLMNAAGPNPGPNTAIKKS